MGFADNLFSNLISFFVLSLLAILIYLKMSEKTLLDFLLEIKEFMYPPIEEIPKLAGAIPR